MSEKASSTKQQFDPINSIGKNLRNILKIYAHEIAADIEPFLFRYQNKLDKSIVVITFSIRKNVLAIEKTTKMNGVKRPSIDKFKVKKKTFFDQSPTNSKKKVAKLFGQNRCRKANTILAGKKTRTSTKRERIEKTRGRNNQTRTTRHGRRG